MFGLNVVECSLRSGTADHLLIFLDF